MINITVHLHTILQIQSPEGPINQLELTFLTGSTLIDLLNKLEISLPPDSLLLAVNGRMAEPEYRLREGDQINLMPAISGGTVSPNP
jgi:sulfur carrier protein ThiS